MQASIGSARAFDSDGTAQSDQVMPKGSTKFTFCTLPTQDGTVQIFRVTLDRAVVAVANAETVSANEENQQTFDGPLGRVFAKYTNTSSASGTVSFEICLADHGVHT